MTLMDLKPRMRTVTQELTVPGAVGRRAAAGLCTSCEHDATCTLRSPAAGAVLECTEHAKPGTVERTKVTLTYGPPVVPSVPRVGLCVNCDNRERCTLRKPDQVVLCCEEYR